MGEFEDVLYELKEIFEKQLSDEKNVKYKVMDAYEGVRILLKQW